MSTLKRLASQTAIYGVSSVLGRFLNYLLVPLLTYTFAPAEYGVVAELYAYMGFLGVLLTFGLETGYFRFRAGGEWPVALVYATVLRVLVLGNLAVLLALVVWRAPIADLLRYAEHPEYIWWVAAILALDSIGAVAFARLRAENLAWRFALIKLIEIAANVGLNLFFILLARPAFEADPNSFLGGFWDPSIGIGYVFIANLAASLLKLALLSPELQGSLGGFDWTLFRRLMRYSLPMVIIGLAGIVNEMLDRAALKYLLPGDDIANLAQLGIYSACYKLSILMILFIQAFRYAGEPFFFAQARQANARATYAAVLNWFVIFCVFIFLLVTLYLDIFQYFVGAAYREGLRVVPVLLLASLLLGVYINLSIWYKLTDRTLMGAWVTLVGSAVTVALLFWTVPRYGYIGAAWAHLACYAVMVGLSYALGRRYYPVPYDLKRVFGYIAFGLVLYGTSRVLVGHLHWNAAVTGTLLLAMFLALTYVIDGRRLRHPPTAPGV